MLLYSVGGKIIQIKNENLNSEEKIDDNCSIIKSQDKLVIKLKFIDEAKSWLFSFIFVLPLWGGIILSLFFDPIGSLYFLIFLIPFTTLIFLGILMFRYRKREWNFDKTTEVI